MPGTRLPSCALRFRKAVLSPISLRTSQRARVPRAPRCARQGEAHEPHPSKDISTKPLRQPNGRPPGRPGPAAVITPRRIAAVVMALALVWNHVGLGLHQLLGCCSHRPVSQVCHDSACNVPAGRQGRPAYTFPCAGEGHGGFCPICRAFLTRLDLPLQSQRADNAPPARPNTPFTPRPCAMALPAPIPRANPTRAPPLECSKDRAWPSFSRVG